MEERRGFESLIFRPGQNCWRIHEAYHATPLIDCANYYRALHSSIAKAQHSIFILGWEIDSQTRLLRGEEERLSPLPSVAVDLLAWKAQSNPGMKIYLLRWEPSFIFAPEREPAPELAWTLKTPEQLHISLDDTAPIGGSQHQKVILIDDELVFTGGMDIARQRWDEREHRLAEPERFDANGPYGPYHDAQIVMDGPVVESFSELVRSRWRKSAGYEAVPIRLRPPPPLNEPVSTWPESLAPAFEQMVCAISRTLPEPENVQEVRQMYLDLIASAEEFIYIENQFLTCLEIARALNQRMRMRPRLRVLIVSSYDPNGLFEREGMWAGRMDFQKTVGKGLSSGRVKMTSSAVLDSTGEPVHKRIHSKVFSVDDRYFVVASSNITQRSMGLDSECDVVLAARDPAQALLISNARDDLIAEHCGWTADQVKAFIESGKSLEDLLLPFSQDAYHLGELNDSQFVHAPLKGVAFKLADPEKPLIGKKRSFRNPPASLVFGGLATVLVLIGAYLLVRDRIAEVNAESLQAFLIRSRHSFWAFPLVLLVYVLGGFIFFPVTVMSLATAAVFGPILGPLYGMCGALLSAAIMYSIGHFTGFKGLRKILGDRIRRIGYQFRESGVIGVAIIRLLPIAPFSLVNLAAGVSSVRFFDFIFGSFLGLLPAFLAKGILGDSLTEIFIHPTFRSVSYLFLGVCLWIGLVFASYIISRQIRKRQET